MNENITPEGIEVRPGQVWQELPRHIYGGRVCTVVSVIEGKAKMREHGAKRRPTVSVSLMFPHYLGWKLLSEQTE